MPPNSQSSLISPNSQNLHSSKLASLTILCEICPAVWSYKTLTAKSGQPIDRRGKCYYPDKNTLTCPKCGDVSFTWFVSR